MRNNKLDERRDFYIHLVVRDGKTYDEVESRRKKEDKASTVVNDLPRKNGKRIISYAESFGYHRDPSRYDNLRPNKPLDEEKVIVKEDVKIENGKVDEEIGYYDEGVRIEEATNNSINKEEISQVVYDDYYASLDQIYQENFVNQEEVDDVNYERFYQPIEREDIKPNPNKENLKVNSRVAEAHKSIAKEPIQTKSNPQKYIMDDVLDKEMSDYVKKGKKQNKPTKKIKYIAPSLDLLTKSDEKNAENYNEAEVQKEIINNTFKEAGIRAEVERYIFGPTVTQFLISIEKGANVKDIRKVESNLLMYLQCETIRIQTPIPGKPFAGIEVPKKVENRRTVFLGDMLVAKDFKNLDYVVPVAVGQDNYGIYHYIDLVEMPHGLIAGTTKSGKSVCLNAFLLSLIYRFTPEELRIVLIDPKRIELGIYEGIPHLAMPVIVDQEDFQSALGWVYDEMERRYKEFELYDEHNIIEYNKIRKENKESQMPHIIVIMDEFSDWFADANSEIELYMQKLAAKARAAGINIILATQRPSKDVIKGTIKANFDTRIAFRVSSFEDAKVIMGYGGAEKLEGKGDMLIRYAGRAEQRLQGAFVPSSDIKKITRFLKENNTCDYLVTKEEIHQSTVSRQTSSSMGGANNGRDDERFEEVAYYVIRNNNASANQLTQIFNMGFNRINAILLALENMQVLSPGVKGKQREVLVDEFEFTDMLERNE